MTFAFILEGCCLLRGRNKWEARERAGISLLPSDRWTVSCPSLPETEEEMKCQDCKPTHFLLAKLFLQHPNEGWGRVQKQWPGNTDTVALRNVQHHKIYPPPQTYRHHQRMFYKKQRNSKMKEKRTENHLRISRGTRQRVNTLRWMPLSVSLFHFFSFWGTKLHVWPLTEKKNDLAHSE